MGPIDEMLKNEKVEWKELKEIAYVTGAGVDKKIKENEQKVRLLNYMDVYKNLYLDKSIPDMIVTANNCKINECDIKYGDIFITPSSETKDDIFMSSVAREDIENTVYSYHIMRIRLKDNNFMTACFLNYVFKSNVFRKNMLRKVYGNTRQTIAKSEIDKLIVPIPSIETQEKIVKTLDIFTNYVTELQAELQMRTYQYSYYRDFLLSETYLNKIAKKIDNWEDSYQISYKKIKDVCLRQRGIKITAKEMKELNKESAPIRVFAGGNTVANLEPSIVGAENILEKPSVIVKSRGNIDFEYYDKLFTHKNEMWSYSSLDKNVLNIKFLFYLLKKNLKYFRDRSISGKLPQISIGVTDHYKIPLPDIKVQNRVVEILDKFQDLLADTQGLLPEEIEKRQKQYEYYREKLLTFDENMVEPNRTNNS